VKLLVMQGGNMSMMGHRLPEIYGTTKAPELDEMIRAHAKERSVEVEIFYTNSDAEFTDRTYKAWQDGIDGIVTNTGAFCFGSYLIRECFNTVTLPIVEIHMSNQIARGTMSVTGAGADAVILGLGVDVYMIGIDACIRLVNRKTARSAAA
jgi:3-dehydroquinate dehydratase-2